MKAVAAIMLMMAVVCVAGCNKSDDPNNGGNQSNHEYVDLGLPSGTLWATCNVGANVPEEFGDYFAWGETQSKNIYDWNTYIYGTDNYLTKYCSSSYCGLNGFVDNLTTLESSDDAATTNWGKGWRTPTYEDWCELYQFTTNAKITQNGVNGRLFTASNGNSLFLPAAGFRWEHELRGAGNRGLYLSSSLLEEFNAWYFSFDSDYENYGMIADDRADGNSVRPVRSAK